jgi:ubiquinone/menaquinone biosynthesis C-methylase UbiE
MRVLDLGSGAGDMSFVVADVVGSAGTVIGVERSPEALAEATAKTERVGRANVRFVPGDIHAAVDDGAFDAVVCRLVLMYVPDPSAC